MSANPIPDERTFRLSSCGDRCIVVNALVPGQFGRSELLLHDPDTHEQYGRRLATGDEGIIRTGRLAVDLGRASVTVDNRDVLCSGAQYRMLTALASECGRLLDHARLAEAVWGPTIFCEPEPVYRHALRVAIARLRRQVFPAGGMISTVISLGYRLERVEIGADPPSAEQNYFLRTGRWALDWDACRICGLTDLPHNGQGSCTSCHGRSAPRPRRGIVARHHVLLAQRAAPLATTTETPS